MDTRSIVEAHASGAFNFLPKPEEYNTHVRATVVYASDKVINSKRVFTGPCHAAILGNVKKDSLAVVTSCKAGTETIPGAEIYYNWLLNHSDWAPSFLVKDPKLSMRYGFVQDAAGSGTQFLGGAQLCRLPASEFHESFLAICAILAYNPDFPVLPLVVLALTNGWKLSHNNNFVETKSFSHRYIMQNNYGHLPWLTIQSDAAWEELLAKEGNRELPANDRPLNLAGRWPANTNAWVVDTKKTGSNEKLQAMLKAVYCDQPTYLFGIVPNEEKKVNYNSFFKEAIGKVQPKNLIHKNNGIKCTPVNFNGLLAYV